ncbi:hypothetical protein [Streptomyces tendae]
MNTRVPKDRRRGRALTVFAATAMLALTGCKGGDLVSYDLPNPRGLAALVDAAPITLGLVWLRTAPPQILPRLISLSRSLAVHSPGKAP